MENNKYIPQSKFDVGAIEYLKLTPFYSVINDVSVLLSWLQDTNWPVANGIVEYLAPHVNVIAPQILHVLKSNDASWKYNLISGLISRCSSLDPSLIAALQRLFKHPTEQEKREYVNQAAEAILTKLE